MSCDTDKLELSTVLIVLAFVFVLISAGTIGAEIATGCFQVKHLFDDLELVAGIEIATVIIIIFGIGFVKLINFIDI